jgi:hypothetical protein
MLSKDDTSIFTRRSVLLSLFPLVVFTGHILVHLLVGVLQITQQELDNRLFRVAGSSPNGKAGTWATDEAAPLD